MVRRRLASTARTGPAPGREGGTSCRAGAAQRCRAWGFLIGAVLCFAFFSWYPIVREIIMSFQKPVLRRRLYLGRLEQLHPDRPRPDVLAGLAEHAGIHAAGAGHRVRGAVLRRDLPQRAAARPGLPADPGLPAGDAAAGLGAAAVPLLLQPAVRPVRRHPALPAPADLAVGAAAGHGFFSIAMLSVVIASTWMNMGGATLIYLAALQNIPGELYEAAELDGAGSGQADPARHDPADQAHPAPAADAADRRDHADVHRVVRAHQRRRRGGTTTSSRW